MKFAARLLVLSLLLALGMMPAGAAASRPGPARNSGRTYVRLDDWARANQFAIRWLDQEKSLLLSNRWARLAFNTSPNLDLRKAEINGVGVWLAFPMIFQNRSAYISQVDLDQTLAPILFPPGNPAGIKVKTVCIDPGHGGPDPGYRVGSHEEKKYTLLLAKEVQDQLNEAGFKVVLTRASDIKVPLETRPRIARLGKADLFVSLHFNAYPAASEVKGVEVYCCTPPGATSFNAEGKGDTRWVPGNQNNAKNVLLASQVQQALVKNLQIEDRGIKRARYQVLTEATLPAILIEGGFMSNPAEGKKIYDPAYRRQMARAIVDGVLAYKRIVKG